MAEFIPSDFDDISFDIEIECPECENVLTISLDDEQVTCPHCGTEITIESES